MQRGLATNEIEADSLQDAATAAADRGNVPLSGDAFDIGKVDTGGSQHWLTRSRNLTAAGTWPMTEAPDFDIVVVGAGNAALCAALAAAERGARVLVLERAPKDKRGGNSYFTGGLFRVPYTSMDDIRALVPNLGDAEADSITLAPYTRDAFYDELLRQSEHQANAELLSTVVENAYAGLTWLQSKGVEFTIAFDLGAFESGDGYKFWSNTPIKAAKNGRGLVDGLFGAVERLEDVTVWYGARGVRLMLDGDRAVAGVEVRRGSDVVRVRARSVVLASGGFEADPEMRAKYLGPGWDLAKVRGTEFNSGDGIKMALEIGAQPFGQWSGCHAVAWDAGAPPTGDRRVGEAFQKHSYPFSIVVNRNGARFIDEGADFIWLSYSSLGREILKQPGMVAFQIFDSKVMHLLSEDYHIEEATKSIASELSTLAEALQIDPEGFTRTVAEFNAGVSGGSFDPATRDGLRTLGIEPRKSNWAQTIDSPPYVGYAVTCGITFTFGGLRVGASAEVLEADEQPIRGLFAAGELVGGLFCHGYPGGSGLTAGLVFGRIAGYSAAANASCGPTA